MGVPRVAERAAWRFTNYALRAAAMGTGAAYVSTASIADDRNIGGIGVPIEALAAANSGAGGYNHPGIYEFRVYEQAPVTQLWLS